jgi:hypothetical protein
MRCRQSVGDSVTVSEDFLTGTVNLFITHDSNSATIASVSKSNLTVSSPPDAALDKSVVRSSLSC